MGIIASGNAIREIPDDEFSIFESDIDRSINEQNTKNTGNLDNKNSEDPIWHEEINSPSPKLVYPYRWDVIIKKDNLGIIQEKITTLTRILKQLDKQGTQVNKIIIVLHLVQRQIKPAELLRQLQSKLKQLQKHVSQIQKGLRTTGKQKK
jgi:hypothetical protein